MEHTEHPSSDELLRWQGGDLGPTEASLVEAHVSVCPDCESKIADFSTICKDFDWVSAEWAQRRLRSAISAGPSQSFFTRRRVTSGVAAALVAAVVIFSLANLTQEARADSLLSKAIRRETAGVPHRRLMHFRSGGEQCQWDLGPDGSQSVTASLKSSSFCGRVAVGLHSAAWTDPLSAKDFQQWRKSLKKKVDTIKQLANVTEVATDTKEGLLRSAALDVRVSDYHPVAAHFRFVDSSGTEQPAVDVTEEEAPQQIAQLPISAPLEPKEPHPDPSAAVMVDPMDVTEARVRLALHRLGADANVLLSVDRQVADINDRQGAGIRVWGVVPDDKTKNAISDELRGSSDVRVDVLSDAEEALQQAPLPWAMAQGDSPPLGLERVNNLFSNNREGRQVFLIGLDDLTRRLAGEARTRDALLALASSLQSSEYRDPLRAAIVDLGSRMAADTASLATQLQPLIGKVPAPSKPLSYARAMELYTLVREVVFQGRSNESLTLDDALARIRALIAKS